MTDSSTRTFFLDEHELQTFIVFTDEYAIFTYQKILRWRAVKSVTLSDHYLAQDSKSGQSATVFPEYKAYKFEYLLEGNTKSEIIIKLYPNDLEQFISYLKDKVPQVTTLV